MKLYFYFYIFVSKIVKFLPEMTQSRILDEMIELKYLENIKKKVVGK